MENKTFLIIDNGLRASDLYYVGTHFYLNKDGYVIADNFPNGRKSKISRWGLQSLINHANVNYEVKESFGVCIGEPGCQNVDIIDKGVCDELDLDINLNSFSKFQKDDISYQGFVTPDSPLKI